jgi:hypothetical protein
MRRIRNAAFFCLVVGALLGGPATPVRADFYFESCANVQYYTFNHGAYVSGCESACINLEGECEGFCIANQYSYSSFSCSGDGGECLCSW